MLVNAGRLCDADHVVDGNSFSSLPVSSAKHGHSQKVVNFFQRSLAEIDGTPSDAGNLIALLKACVTLQDAKRGCLLHAEIARHRLLKTDTFVGSSLVDMYAKCGLLSRAEEVFDEILNPDAATWNALISGYTRHDQGHKALDCFTRMQAEGISPDIITYICTLKACGSINAIEKGKEVHGEVTNKGLLKKHVNLGNALVDMYVKFGLLGKAQEVFNQLSIRDVVSWNTLIGGYAKHGRSDEALKCFEQLQREEILPDSVSFICALKACGSLGALEKGIQIHKKIAKTRLLETDLVLGNAMIDMYAKCGMLEKAQEVFDKMPVRDLISWNTLVAGYVKYEYMKEALGCYEKMQHEGISPSGITLVGLLKACSNLKAIDKGFEVHRVIVQKGLESDVVLSSTLLDTYAKCGWLVEAQKVFDRLTVRDVVAWTSLIAGYAEHGYSEQALTCFRKLQEEGICPDAVTFVCILKACASLKSMGQAKELHAEITERGLERDPDVGNPLVDMLAKCGLVSEAQGVFDKLPVQDIVSWTSLIGGYAESGQGEEALLCFERMKTQGVPPNAVTYVFTLKACSSIGAIGKGQDLHGEISGKQLLEIDFIVGNALVDMYAKCGLTKRAKEVFEKLTVREIVSWNALITGYAQQGEIGNVVVSFNRMIREGVNPGLVTFVSLLNACSHAGLVYRGQMYFKVMKENFGIIPTLEHYTCMVDLFCRAGQLGKATVMLMKMPVYTDLIIWRSLLGACQKWGNTELGSHAFHQLMQLDEADSAAYISISNIFADADNSEHNEPD